MAVAGVEHRLESLGFAPRISVLWARIADERSINENQSGPKGAHDKVAKLPQVLNVKAGLNLNLIPENQSSQAKGKVSQATPPGGIVAPETAAPAGRDGAEMPK